jgi:hypothetical protein
MNKRSLLFWIFLIQFVSSYCYGQETEPIRKVIDECNLDSLKSNVGILSGEISYKLNDDNLTIKSRHSFQPGNIQTKEYLVSRLKNYGLTVIEQVIDPNHKNVLGIQNGIDNSKTVIICAHYDCCGSSYCEPDSAITAYGADDNASGVSATLECARILSKYKTKYKVIYAFWNEEEQGLIGSCVYARAARDNKENILGVINLDMIGWNSKKDGHVEIHAQDPTLKNFINLSETVININNTYEVGLKPVVYKPGTTRSDHACFWFYNINAVLLIEGLASGDFNQSYHSQQDRMEKFNMDYFHKVSKLAIASMAYISGISLNPITLPEDFSIAQNYPNPFNSETKINYSIAQDGYVSIKVYNVLGQLIETLVSEYKSAGFYNATFNARDITSGVYFYTIQSGGYGMSKKMMYLK